MPDPLPSVPPTPELLYKYVGCAPHHVAILERLRIRFTQPDGLNDPFDCVPGVAPPIDIGRFVDDTMARNRPIILASGRTEQHIALARDNMVREYTENPDALVARCTAIIRANLNSLGVLSLASRNDNMPLWAHYSANHSGFAIGFLTSGRPLTKRATDFASEGELRPVVYRPDRVVVPCDPLVLTPDVLFIKGSQWAYEDEWRVVRRLASCDHAVSTPAGVHLCDIAPRTIARVDVGMNAVPATVDAILAATAPGTPLQHVSVYRARLNAGGAALTFDLLRAGC